MCTRKTKSLRSHSTFCFSFLQVALSLEGHSSEVQVVKHLLHVRPHLPSPLQPLQGSSASTRCMDSPWAPKALGSSAGSPGARDVPVSSHALLAPWKFHSHECHWFLCFSPTFFLDGTRRQSDKRENSGLDYKERERRLKRVCTGSQLCF